jgi:diaminopimelate epimerase
MCGNGLRCVALHLARRDGLEETQFVVDTDAGALRCDVSRETERAMVGTQIGRGSSVGSLEISHAGSSYFFHRIETGNPHAICFRAAIENSLLDQLGPLVSGSVSGGANVEIATIKNPTEIDVTVWERGVGRTLACGTGAAATVISATLNGLSPHDVPVRVNLPGGSLEITVSQNQTAYLKGPAEWVYSATAHE